MTEFNTITMLEWIEALESDLFEQGKYQLTSPYGQHCCLGVACVIGNAPSKKVDDDTSTTYLMTNESIELFAGEIWAEEIVSGVTAADINAAFSVTWEDPNGEGRKPVGYLTHLNDQLDYSFKEIAQYLRDNCNLEATIRFVKGEE